MSRKTPSVTRRSAGPIFLGSPYRGPTKAVVAGHMREDVENRWANPEKKREAVSIALLEEKVTKLHKEKKYREAIRKLEAILKIKEGLVEGDLNDRDLRSTLERLVSLSNNYSTYFLQKGNFDGALDLLKKAEHLTDPSYPISFDRRIVLRAVTFNNMACYFRRRGKPNAALQYVEKALKLEDRYKEADNPAGTHLNMGAILSQLGRHEGALKHTKQALQILIEEQQQLDMHSQQEGMGMGSRATRDSVPLLGTGVHPSAPEPLPEGRLYQHASALAVAHHNLAVEEEHLRQWDSSLESHEKAHRIAEQYLGKNAPLTVRLESAFNNCVHDSYIRQSRSTDGTREQARIARPIGLKLPPIGETKRSSSVPKSRLPTISQNQRAATPPTFSPYDRELPSVVKTVSPPRGGLSPGRFSETLPDPVEQSNIPTQQVISALQNTTIRPTPPTSTPPKQGLLRPRERILKTGKLSRELMPSQLHSPMVTPGAVSIRPDSGIQPEVSLRSGDTTRRTAIRLVLAARQALKEEKAATRLQSFVRGFVVRNRIRREIEKMQTGKAIKVQALYRSFDARKKLRKQHFNVSMLEALFRGYMERKNQLKRLEAAVNIQSHLRGYNDRNFLYKRDTAASVIQTWYKRIYHSSKYNRELDQQYRLQANLRMFLERGLHYRPLREAAITLQSGLKGYHQRKLVYDLTCSQIIIAAYWKRAKAMMVYHELRDAAVTVQAFFRGYSCRKHDFKEGDGANLIRRWVLGHYARIKHKRRMEAAKVISRLAKGYIARKRMRYITIQAVKMQKIRMGIVDRKTVMVMRRSATDIQRIVRARMAWNRVRLMWRSSLMIVGAVKRYRAQGEAADRRHATIVIQTLFRRLLYTNHYTEDLRKVHLLASFLKSVATRRMINDYRHQIITLQRYSRGFLVRNQNDQYKRGAIVIQTYWRRFMARKEYEHRRDCVVVIQKFIRGFLAKKAFEQKRQAAIYIQCRVKCISQQNKFQSIRRSAVYIQALERRRCALLWRKQATIAASKIQSMQKACWVRREYRHKLDAISIIQRNWRIHIAWKKVRKLVKSGRIVSQVMRIALNERRNAKRLDAARIIQRWSRLMLWNKRQKEMEQAAIVLQKWTRMMLVKMRLFRFKKVIMQVQSAWRIKAILRRQVLERRSATVIQAACRGCLVRIVTPYRRLDLYSNVDIVKDSPTWNAALIIQAAARRWLVWRRIERQKVSAVHIQTWIRSEIYPKHLSDLTHNVVAVQAHMRGCLDRMVISREHRAALVIQTSWKSLLVQNKMVSIHNSANLIQSMWSMKCEVNRMARLRAAQIMIAKVAKGWIVWNHHQRVMLSAQTLQRYWRGCLTRQFTDPVRESYRLSCIVIQSQWRGYLGRREFSKRMAAVVTIQAYWRRWLQMRRYRKLRKSHDLARKLAKGYCVRRNQIRRESAAVVIQKNLRMIRDRNVVLGQVYAASVIQRGLARTYLARQTAKKRLEAVLKVQSVMRVIHPRQITMGKANQAAATIFACWCGHKTRLDLRNQRKAAALIQRSWRSHCFAVDYRKRKAAVVLLQTQYRSNRARVQYKNKQKAVELIQRRCKGSAVRMEFKRRVEAAVKIQNRVRLMQTLEHQKQRQQAATVIQAMTRRMVERDMVENMIRSNLILQTNYRAFRSRKAVYDIKGATLVLQRSARGRIARRECIVQRDAAAKIQRAFLSYCVKKEQERVVQSANKIQSVLSLYFIQKQSEKEIQAATTIQSFVRMSIQKRRLQSIRAACTTVQRMYRGQLSRKRVEKMKQSAIVIQSIGRMFVYRNRYLKTIWAVNVISSYFKMGPVRKQHLQFVKSVRIIQTNYRSMQMQRLFALCGEAALVLQRAFRRRRLREKFLETYTAGIVVQKYGKMVLARRRFLRARLCITLVQARIKGIIARRRYVALKSVTQRVQLNFRAYRKRVQTETEYKAACDIERIWRGYQCRKSYRAAVKRVVMIQAIVRRNRVRRGYLEKRLRIICVQKFIRARSARRKFLKVVRAASSISKTFKAWRVRQEVAKQVRARIIVQKYAKRWIAIRRAEQRKQAIIKLQACIRGTLASIAFLKVIEPRRAAQNVIERCIHSCIYSPRDREIASVMIQSRWRGYIQRKKSYDNEQKKSKWEQHMIITSVVTTMKYRALFQSDQKLAGLAIYNGLIGMKDRRFVRDLVVRRNHTDALSCSKFVVNRMLLDIAYGNYSDPSTPWEIEQSWGGRKLPSDKMLLVNTRRETSELYSAAYLYTIHPAFKRACIDQGRSLEYPPTIDRRRHILISPKRRGPPRKTSDKTKAFVDKYKGRVQSAGPVIRHKDFPPRSLTAKRAEAATVIQTHWRGAEARAMLKVFYDAVIRIQRWYRKYVKKAPIQHATTAELRDMLPRIRSPSAPLSRSISPSIASSDDDFPPLSPTETRYGHFVHFSPIPQSPIEGDSSPEPERPTEMTIEQAKKYINKKLRQPRLKRLEFKSQEEPVRTRRLMKQGPINQREVRITPHVWARREQEKAVAAKTLLQERRQFLDQHPGQEYPISSVGSDVESPVVLPLSPPKTREEIEREMREKLESPTVLSDSGSDSSFPDIELMTPEPAYLSEIDENDDEIFPGSSYGIRDEDFPMSPPATFSARGVSPPMGVETKIETKFEDGPNRPSVMVGLDDIRIHLPDIPSLPDTPNPSRPATEPGLQSAMIQFKLIDIE